MDFMTYSSNGQAICAAHRRIVCGQCCVDFTGPEFQRDSEEEGEDDRVFVLGTGVNRFVPQWDEQLLGPGNVFSIEKDYNNPPKPEHLQALDLVTCSDCEVTWLVGKAGHDAAASHPSHHTSSHQYAGTRRSLVVYTDGACTDNGRATAKAGVGVYFGPQSKYNISAPPETSIVPTNQVAELSALIRALQTVHKDIVPARSILVHGSTDTKHLRLILVTDSSYAVECMCKHWTNWTLDEKRKVLKNRQGKEVANSKLLLAIKDEVERLSRVGVQVVYYHVHRDFNKNADLLAKAGVAAKETVRVGGLSFGASTK